MFYATKRVEIGNTSPRTRHLVRIGVDRFQLEDTHYYKIPEEVAADLVRRGLVEPFDPKTSDEGLAFGGDRTAWQHPGTQAAARFHLCHRTGLSRARGLPAARAADERDAAGLRLISRRR